MTHYRGPLLLLLLLVASTQAFQQVQQLGLQQRHPHRYHASLHAQLEVGVAMVT
jgi:hypothetical protein